MSKKRKFGEVFTPIKTIRNMLNLLNQHYFSKTEQSIFENPNLRWFDPACGIGNFMVVLYHRLMKGLENVFPDEKQRKSHILTKMLYMSELNKKNCFVIKELFGYPINLYQGDTLGINFKNEWDINTFDVVIGNPPYNTEQKKSGSSPLFHLFVYQALKIAQYISFILPSRYFAGGKGLDKFRKAILERTDIVSIKQFNDASTIFGNSVDIKGGVHYLLVDSQYSGKCNYNGIEINLNQYDILVDDVDTYTLIDKIKKVPNITSLYMPRGYYGLETNVKVLDTNDKECFKCFVSKQKGSVKYILKNKITKKCDFYKVLVPKAAHKGKSGFGITVISPPNSVYTGTFFGFKVDGKDQAESLFSYLQCRLPNYMLSLRKITQDISSKTLEWIPLPPLDREWTDKKIYKYFQLSKQEIDLVNNAVIIGY